MPNMIREVLVEQKMIYEERIANIIAERDDARREVCELKSRNFERVITRNETRQGGRCASSDPLHTHMT